MGNQPILYSTDRAIARNFVEKRLVIEYFVELGTLGSSKIGGRSSPSHGYLGSGGTPSFPFRYSLEYPK